MNVDHMDRLGATGDYRGFTAPSTFSIQERALAYAMLFETDSSVADYSVDDQGTRHINAVDETELPQLLEKFKRDPKTCLAYGRSNILAVAADQRISGTEKTERIQRYIKAYLDLQIKLDKLVFPADQEVKQGVPEYVPDGLTDMGSDDRVDPRFRSRGKTRVDKEKFFKQARPLFDEILSKDWSQTSSEKFKKYVAERIAHFVYTEMPYDYKDAGPLRNAQHSVPMSAVVGKHLAVCRHHAMATQVLLQAFGLTGRLLKCDLNTNDGRGFGAHAANLVRVDYKWYLLDTTSPDVQAGVGEIFVRPIPQTEIDLNSNEYEWDVKRKKDGKIWTYRSRNNMFYKITGNL